MDPVIASRSEGWAPERATLSLMELRQATLDDMRELVSLRNRLAQWLLDRGIDQWHPDQIDIDHLTAWIEAGYVFVHDRDGRIAVSVSILWNDPLIWGADNGDSGYVHMLMVDRAWAGHGLGERALTSAEQRISNDDKDRTRLDVTASNDALQGWYVERGYEVVGTREFDRSDWNDVVLLQKDL